VHEDAAGASVVSKWLGRTSDPSSLGPRSLAAATVSAGFQAKVTQESHPGATGVGRGPFTHTILPHTSSRKRVFGAVGVLGLSCAAAALMLLLRQPPKPETAATLHANLASNVNAAESPALATVERPLPSPAPPAPVTASAVTPVVASAAPAEAARALKAAAPRPVVAPGPLAAASPRATHPVVNSPPAPSKPSSAVTSPPAPAKARDRPLDLLAPY